MKIVLTAMGVFVLAGGMLLAGPSVRPLGVTVIWEDVKEEFKGFPTLNQQDPVRLALLVDMGGLGIIELNKKTSEVESLADDKGTDLEGELWAFPSTSEDGKLMRVEIKAGKKPADGAGSLTAKGKFGIITGSKTAVQKSKVVDAKKGETVEVSPELVFKISEAGKPQWGDDPFMVELEINRDIPEVAEVVFYDGDGELIESKAGGSSRMGFNKSVTLQKTYNLKRKVDRFRVEAKIWTDLEESSVPFEVTVGVGGQQ